MTVSGVDHVGIVAAVTAELARRNVNIFDISQTIMGEYFTMILRIGFDDKEISLGQLQDAMAPIEARENMVIRVQSEALFTAINEI